MKSEAVIVALVGFVNSYSDGLAPPVASTTRRGALSWIGGACISGCIASGGNNVAVAADTPEGVDVDSYLRTGMVPQPMGVSGQAGKSKPETGVILRDGSEVFRDPRTGDVSAEILVKGASGGDYMPVLASFSAPWPLATGTVYDVECRDADSGDGAFLAVSPAVGGKALGDLKDSFFVKSLFGTKGRFSSYGTPTDIKVKNSELKGDYRVLDVNFSTLSQSTQTEIPRKAKIVATIPNGSEQVVMLVGSASALRWKKGSEKAIVTITDSFRAVRAPETALKIRAKERRS